MDVTAQIDVSEDARDVYDEYVITPGYKYALKNVLAHH
jgi:hypothetical protein